MRNMLPAVALVLGTALSALAQSNFVRVTNAALTAESFLGGGAAWADYDGDGWLDLAQATFGGPVRLFHNNGNGTFTPVTNGVYVSGPWQDWQPFGVSWGDFDNDGHPDLFYSERNDAGIGNLFLHNSTATGGDFVRLTTGPGSLSLAGRSSGCAWADYDRDGFLDLFVANS